MAALSRLRIGRRGVFDGAGVLAAVLLVGGPALFTNDGFALDFTNHLWLVFVQQHAIQHDLLPTPFLNTPTQGAFDPFFLFYGGTLYGSAGLLAVLLGGHTVVAYVAVIVASIAAAYGGFLWLARELGVRSWMAHVPAITFATSAYYVTNLYGRGDWPETVASSVMPLLVASAWRLARAPRIELTAATAFVLSVVFFSGSHNITLMWGSIVLVATAIGLRVALGRAFPAVSARRAVQLACLAVLALAVNAWFLVPDVLHASSTEIAGVHFTWGDSAWINQPQVLFDPLRYVPRHLGTPALYVQAPVWLLLWALACVPLLRGDVVRRLRRSFVVLAIVLVGLLALILVQALYELLPRLLQAIQVPYRLNTFVSMAAAGLVLVGVLAVERASVRAPFARRLRLGLGLVVAISVGLCVWQLWVPSTHSVGSYADRDRALVSVHQTPESWYESGGTYADVHSPVVASEASPMLQLDTRRIEGDDVTLTVAAPPGPAPFATNIIGGPYAVDIHGLERLGRTPDGRVVVRRAHAGAGPVKVTIERSGGLTAPMLISLIALGALVALFVRTALSGALARRGRPRIG